jgi:hypothetical protein
MGLEQSATAAAPGAAAESACTPLIVQVLLLLQPAA